MAILHTNQVRQLYVVSSVVTDPATITTASAAGTTAIVGVNADTSNFGEPYGYVITRGADTIERSDIVKEDQIVSIKHTTAAAMQRPLQKYTVTLDPNVNGGAPIAGQTYELKIYFREWIGVSPEDQYYKFGMVYAYAGMTAAQFYQALYDSLVLNFKREPAQVLNFTVSGTGLTVEEVEQPWQLGMSNANTSVVNFSLVPDEVLLNGDLFKWGIVTPVTPTTFVPNGHAIADMEYFYHGERGDIYRNVGWPNVWITKLLVDPTQVYDTFDILFNFEGENQESYHSRKVLTLVVPAAAVGATNTALTNAFPDVPILLVDVATPAGA